ncbi:hypothetical protein CAOG_00621 [Capsaspora owczarzaki ATCC 30864]|uniref:Ribosomal protein S15 n=1 Tax=Capsaspora owczarzaki (strain ATCC 30864) TaxID=595528 RepID=A0A0D2X0H5_CAPO3|nr:hypothetical protein CAOG_00621 [Capsaspora owczarzaki ATCC 30864]KJE89069.1 hypothetical protein CAOG_000621 [Capsaspora owczarzaki ATCC 30864]|eukprot:XP_004365492.1 hypothetical protein CAOG_00621 [Capsaspora owczarzaki ATCC 30864]
MLSIGSLTAAAAPKAVAARVALACVASSACTIAPPARFGGTYRPRIKQQPPKPGVLRKLKSPPKIENAYRADIPELDLSVSSRLSTPEARTRLRDFDRLKAKLDKLEAESATNSNADERAATARYVAETLSAADRQTKFLPVVGKEHDRLTGGKFKHHVATMEFEAKHPVDLTKVSLRREGSTALLPNIVSSQSVEDFVRSSPALSQALSVHMGTQTEVVTLRKREVAADLQRHTHDTGSAEVQVAMLSIRIQQLIQHLNSKTIGRSKDHRARRTLMLLAARRRRMLLYLQRQDVQRYFVTLKTLGLKTIVPANKYDSFERARQARVARSKSKKSSRGHQVPKARHDWRAAEQAEYVQLVQKR